MGAGLIPVTGHPSEFLERSADSPSVKEHRERQLKVFATDPSRGSGPLNVVKILIPYEELAPGPIGRQIAVVDEDLGLDFDTSRRRRRRKAVTYPPVDLNASEVLLAGGLHPSEMDLQSHQQMVYAVAMRTIAAFERALDRRVVWPWASPGGDRLEDRLRIYPHAGEFANAFFDKTDDGGSLKFGYFRHRLPDDSDASSELTYTALSYDVVAHEMVHPIVQALAPQKTDGDLESIAFHEGFADVIAMLQHFDFHDLVVDVITRTGGRIHETELAADFEFGSGRSQRSGQEALVRADLRESNPLFEIGQQLGQAVGKAGALRKGVMGKPDPSSPLSNEPHEMGAALTAAILDAFITIYARRTADLRLIGGLGRADAVVTPDLALRMAAEACKTGQHFQTICIRALNSWDNTPDLKLSDYLRALITSDCNAVPNDELGYREALIEGFRARDIVPHGVKSLSEDGLRWPEVSPNSTRRGRRAVQRSTHLPTDKRPTGPPNRRKLKTFAFDPSSGTAAGNRLTLSLPYEPVKAGPIGRQVAVVDYDATNDRYYTSVDLDTPVLIERNGLDPSDIDPLFHQQMVYAVSMSTIDRFQRALGRSVRWPWAGRKTKGELGDQLRIHPHAMQEPNAYYDRRLRALLFGYFAASTAEPGRNLPGQIVYTCLSADIVAHETTHALLDSVQPFFLERTGPDAPAFHEAFADVISLLGHFSYADALLDTIQRTGGLIQRDLLNPDATPTDGAARVAAERSQRNPLVDLALQFGESLGNRAALRSALGRTPDPADLRNAVEAHDRGAILVAAIFDAFFSVYLRRIADLLRIGRGSGAISGTGDIHPDLAKRLAHEATDTAVRISSIASRALDFCPPVDIELGDYLRGLITSDYERAPDDPLGYRAAMIEAFRARGIYPSTAWSMTEEALRWDRVPDGPKVDGLVGGRLTQAQIGQNAVLLRDFAMREAGSFGMAPDLRIDVKAIQTSASQLLDRTGESRTEFTVHLMQQRELPLDPDDEQSPVFTFRGGCTLVLDDAGTLKYVIGKRLDSERRLSSQRAYLSHDASAAAASPYRGRLLPRASLARLHRGL